MMLSERNKKLEVFFGARELAWWKKDYIVHWQTKKAVDKPVKLHILPTSC